MTDCQCEHCRVLIGPGRREVESFTVCGTCFRDFQRWQQTRSEAPAVPVAEKPKLPRWLSTKQVARLLGVKPATIRQMVNDGRLRAVVLPGTGRVSPNGKRYRFIETEIRELEVSLRTSQN